MMTPLRPAPASYDRTLAFTTMHYRAPSFGTVATPDTLALTRLLEAQGDDAALELCDPDPVAMAWAPYVAEPGDN